MPKSRHSRHHAGKWNMEIDPRLRDPGPPGPPPSSAYSPLQQQQGNDSSGHQPVLQSIQVSDNRPYPESRDVYRPRESTGMYPSPHDQPYSASNGRPAYTNGPAYDSPYHSPTSPHSAERESSQHKNGPGTPTGASQDTKRPRACEACRGLKVRCDIDPKNPEGSCKRCAKAGRNCIVTAPSRKRQKKTDSRVAELEKKIDALTQSLQAKGAGQLDAVGLPPAVRRNPYEQVTNGGYGTAFDRPDARPPPPGSWKSSSAGINAPPPMVIAGQKRKFTDIKDQSPLSRQASVSACPKGPGDVNWTSYDSNVDRTAGPKADLSNEYADVIDKGSISTEVAAQIFDRYVNCMAPHLPAVIFSSGTTAAEVRKTQPILFLAILSAASGTHHADLQRTLTREVMALYADRILCRGEKSLELIQALLVSTIWYWPPEHFEELKFYTLIHLAAVMAIDTNISRRTKSSHKTPTAGLWRDHQWRRTAFALPETLASRRAWLGCYFMCCNASMGLRRPNLIRWTNYMEECVDVLETSPEAAPSDKFLCQWVRSQHIAEIVGQQFSMDDPFASVTISDAKVQYAMKGFEMDLEKWSDRVPLECRKPSLKMTEHVINLYMHEVAMHVDHNVEEFKPPFTEETLRGTGSSPEQNIPLTAAHIAALSVCLTSIEGIYEAFLSLDTDAIRTLPVFHFVRIAYATVVLIKMFFAAAQPNSELGKVIDKDNMKVEYYLDTLLDKFRSAAAEEKSRPAAKFLMVLVMLKTWFMRQKAPKPAAAPAFKTDETPEPSVSALGSTPALSTKPEEPQTRPYSPANTPLQLLSEVATGSTPRPLRPESRGQFGPAIATSSGDWQQPAQPYPYASNSISFDNGMTPIPASFPSGVLSAQEYDFGLDPGMETAMGMTLGDTDGIFGKYFSDDAFFGAMMDAGGGSATFEGFGGTG